MRGTDEVVPNLFHIGLVHLFGHLTLWRVGERRGREQRPVPCPQRSIKTLPAWPGRASSSGMVQLQGDLCRRTGVEAINDTLPRRHVLSAVYASAAWCAST